MSGKSKRDVSDLNDTTRVALLERVMQNVQQTLRLQFDPAEGYEHSRPTLESNSSQNQEQYKLKLRRGRCWGFNVYVGVAMSPMSDGENLTILVHRGSRLEDCLIPIGCLPAAFGVLGIWAYAAANHFFRDPTDPGYLSTLQAKWLMVGSIFAGLLLLLATMGLLTVLAGAIKSLFIDGRQYEQDEQTLHEAFDLTKYEWPDPSAIEPPLPAHAPLTAPDAIGEPPHQQSLQQASEPERSGAVSAIIECPQCATRVIAKADGTCPACQQTIG